MARKSRMRLPSVRRRVSSYAGCFGQKGQDNVRRYTWKPPILDAPPSGRIGSHTQREAIHMTKPGMRQRLRYAFDNTMAKGTLALIAWLAVLSLGVILLATLVAVALQIRPGNADEEVGA